MAGKLRHKKVTLAVEIARVSRRGMLEREVPTLTVVVRERSESAGFCSHEENDGDYVQLEETRSHSVACQRVAGEQQGSKEDPG